MIIPDINLLLYVYDSGSPFHSKAVAWWQDCNRRGASVHRDAGTAALPASLYAVGGLTSRTAGTAGIPAGEVP